MSYEKETTKQRENQKHKGKWKHPKRGHKEMDNIKQAKLFIEILQHWIDGGDRVECKEYLDKEKHKRPFSILNPNTEYRIKPEPITLYAIFENGILFYSNKSKKICEDWTITHAPVVGTPYKIIKMQEIEE